MCNLFNFAWGQNVFFSFVNNELFKFMLAIISKQTRLALDLFRVTLVVFIPRSHMAGTCLGNHTFTAVSAEDFARQKVWVVFVLFVVPAIVFHHAVHHLPQLFFNYRRNYIGKNLSAKLFYTHISLVV